MKMELAAIVLAMLGVASAQDGQQGKKDSLLERALKGDGTVFSEMEESGDVKDLKALEFDPANAGSARLHLAHMGDEEAEQHYACHALTRNLLQIRDVIRQELDFIGGEFTVEIYRQMLDSDQRYQSDIEELRLDHRDYIPMLPSGWALIRLPQLVPEALIPDPRSLRTQHRNEGEEFKKKWRTWIDSHPTDLQKLKPTAAQGVSFNVNYCLKTNGANVH